MFLLMQYCVAANYYWLLVEGVYLYTLLALSVFSEQRIFRLYLTIGWGKAHRHASPPPPQPVLLVGGRPWPLLKLLPPGYQPRSQLGTLNTQLGQGAGSAG